MKRLVLTVGPLAALTVVAASCGEPALTSGDCPGAPTDLKLDVVAPYWGGLAKLEYQVEGEPDSVEIDVYDPHLDLWENYYGDINQRPDGTFVSLVTVSVSESDKDLEHKIRVRSRLGECPPSEWAETKGFTVGNPLPGTTWKSDFTIENDGAMSINSNGAPGYIGPYSLDLAREVSHTLAFGTDATVQEEFKFSIKSGTPGDPYDGCSFDLHFVSDYLIEFIPYQRLKLSNGRPAANATAGSTCSLPSLASMAISISPPFEMNPTFSSIDIDYRELVAKMPGQLRWNANSFADRLSRAVESVAVPTANSIYTNFYVSNATYKKQ